MPKKDVWNVPPIIPDKTRTRLAKKVAPLSKQKILTAREWKFVQEYVSGDGNVTLKEAAIRAGYAPGGASQQAYVMTSPEKSPHVVAAIQAYRAELAQRYNTTYEKHMQALQEIRDKALEAGAYAAAVSAEYRRGQALGTIYVDRKEIRHGTIDAMPKEEVERKLAEIRRIYGAPPPAALIEASTGAVVGSIERDPPFDPNVIDVPTDIFDEPIKIA